MQNGMPVKFARRLFGGRFIAIACAVVFLPLAACAQSSGRQVLYGHVPAAVAQFHLQPTGRLPATNQLRLAIGLPLRDPAGLDDFLAQLYNPASPNFRQFLTPEEFTARFGPTEQDYEEVKDFARANGLAVIGTYGNRLLLDVTGSAAAVEKAFHITLRTYRHPTEARNFFAPDTEPTVDAALPMVDIQGLSDFSRPHPRLHRMDAAVVANARPQNGSAPDSSGAYFGNDFRNAYVPGATLAGAGQIVGLFEADGFYSNDIAAYATAAGNGRTNIPIQTVLLDGYNGVPTTGTNSGNPEVSLDIELAMAIAPGLAKIVVFEGNPANFIPNDILNSMLADSNTVKNLSSSWGWSGGPETTTDTIFKSMAAMGQSFFNASGDSDAFTTGSHSVNGVDKTSLYNTPSSNPYITQAGGTTLTTGANAAYSSETVWNWGGGVGSSGGISSHYSIPSWQTNVNNMAGRGGSTSFRNIPDVALTADNVYVAYGNGTSGEFGGTSCAAPLWAGFVALVNQQAAANGVSSVGFINPAIYAIAAGSNYAVCFHDVTTGNNTWSSSPNLFYATNGYDLCTGLGTPNGTNLINALAPLTLPYFITQPTSQTVTNGASLTFSATAGGGLPLNYQWLFNGTNLPAGGNVSGTTSNVLSITAATTNNSGNYNLIVTNSHGSVTSSVAVLTVGFAPAFSAQPTNLTVLSGDNAVFSAAVSGSTPLVYQWRKNGANLVNGAGISGATSNILTLTAVTTNSSGNYNLFITNNFSVSTSSVATLTVNLLSSTVALASSENPSGFKDNVHFTAAITPTNASGNAQFFTNGVVFDTEPVAAGAAVSTNISSLLRGTNFITAVYTGDASYLPASNSLAQVVTNHPPVAAPAFYTNTANFTLNIPIANLATNWSDVDGDTVSLADVSISTNGITLTNTGTALVYFNSNNVDDQFTCTITDGFGGTNFQTVTIASAPLPDTTPLITGIVVAGDGNVTLSLGGALGYTYILEMTTNLILPVSWQPVATNTLGTNGVWQFNDAQATNFAQRFYRLKLAP
jgi:hypothetical protein